ncbi:hypothetical protein [Butyrivibrio sp. M55]|uniref:hypothetical protein n=1 Tax=Butyrivibrio sp. M55 TaxID=1855323 RepID=UPI0008E9A7F4|nr:hypothetical protein [Butyrivibrio sp. M55]SFU84344.1 hypothetical protein SAMN05216540_11370 [Butyrivibrio sp. M55]
MENSVKVFFDWKSNKKRKSVEEKNIDNKIVAKWDKLDVLYSFIGVYTIGIYVFYKQLCKRTAYQIKRLDNEFFSIDYLSNNYMSFPDLNEVIVKSEFISEYDSVGNVIPIWPGGEC